MSQQPHHSSLLLRHLVHHVGTVHDLKPTTI